MRNRIFPLLLTSDACKEREGDLHRHSESQHYDGDYTAAVACEVTYTRAHEQAYEGVY